MADRFSTSFPSPFVKPANLATVLICLLTTLAPQLEGRTPRAADELLTALHTRLETGAEVDDLVEALDDVPPGELRALEEQVNTAWNMVLEDYLAAFGGIAEGQLAGSARSSNNKEIDNLRAGFQRVRNMDEGAMKKALGETSWPAVQKLRTLMMPTAIHLLEKAQPDFLTQRKRLLLLAVFRNGLLEVRVSLAPPYGEGELSAAEGEIMAGYSRLDREGLRVMKDNAELAEKEELPSAEVAGIRELNEMRLLVGLPALAIDPKLCEASRGHSRDMAEHGFFAHNSPIKGRETPSKRAAEAGTTGGGENIFMGSNNPQAANRGWFFSPGHHKNMFGGSYRRIGLGQHGRHWTQMFGR